MLSQKKEAILYLAVRKIITFSHTCWDGSNDNMHTTIMHNAWECEWHCPTAETRRWKATKYSEGHVRWEARWLQVEDSRTAHKVVYEEKSRKAVNQRGSTWQKLADCGQEKSWRQVSKFKDTQWFFLMGSYWWSGEGWYWEAGQHRLDSLTGPFIQLFERARLAMY